MLLLDANALMEASRLYYGFDLAPGFWTWLEDPGLTGQVGSIKAIKDEVTAGTGDLVDWARRLRSDFWVADDADTVAAMRQIAAWASDPSRPYTQSALSAFLAAADLRLIAHGLARGDVIVTREQPAPEAKKVIKIPDVCNALGVAWVDPFTAYRQLGLELR